MVDTWIRVGTILKTRRDNSAEALRVGKEDVAPLHRSIWKDHLLAMDRLRHGVSLRGYGQQNPLLRQT